MSQTVADPKDVVTWVEKLQEQTEELCLATRYLQTGNKTSHNLETEKFDRFLLTNGKESGEREKTATNLLGSKFVLIVGIGGTGTFLADCLARSGIGHLGLVDKGVVESSHVGNSLFERQHIGWKKASAMKRIVELTNPVVQVEDMCLDMTQEVEEELRVLCSRIGIETPDLVVSCMNSLRGRLKLSEWCVQGKIPFLDVHLSRQTKQGGTIRCFTARTSEGVLASCLNCEEKSKMSSSSLDFSGPTNDPLLALEGNAASLSTTNALFAGLAVQKILQALLPAKLVSGDKATRFSTMYSPISDLFTVSPPMPPTKCTCHE